MTKNRKVLLLTNNNPLVEALSGFLIEQFDKENVKVEEAGNEITGFANYDLIVMMAHQNKDTPASIKGLEKVITILNGTNEMKPKFLILSWFDPLNDIDSYVEYFNPEPEKNHYKLMDTSRCRILQLPVNKDALTIAIKELSETQLNTSP